VCVDGTPVALLGNGGNAVHCAPRIVPPIVQDEDADPLLRARVAQLDAGWSFEQEPAATDGALLGKPDAELGYFPPPASDAEIAGLVDDITLQMCRPARRRAPPRVPSRIR
jgi:hypothetical protein